MTPTQTESDEEDLIQYIKSCIVTVNMLGYQHAQTKEFNKFNEFDDSIEWQRYLANRFEHEKENHRANLLLIPLNKKIEPVWRKERVVSLLLDYVNGVIPFRHIKEPCLFSMEDKYLRRLDDTKHIKSPGSGDFMFPNINNTYYNILKPWVKVKKRKVVQYNQVIRVDTNEELFRIITA